MKILSFDELAGMDSKYSNKPSNCGLLFESASRAFQAFNPNYYFVLHWSKIF
jgi:hypothetical protein